ncbi:hypothetical protein [Sporosarcina sp. NPDC096371]
MFKISSPSIISTWQKVLAEQGIDALYSKKRGRPQMMKDTKKKLS